MKPAPDVVVNEAQARAHPDGLKLVERLDAAIAGTNSEPIHVSTGLFCELHRSERRAAARPMTGWPRASPMTTAILLNERGAGTPEEGVGMFLNAAGRAEEVETVVVERRARGQAQRRPHAPS